MGTELFGADWPLVKDAFVIAGLAVGGGIGLGALVFGHRKKGAADKALSSRNRGPRGELEERVRVLERIATDRPAALAEEIEALRGEKMETN